MHENDVGRLLKNINDKLKMRADADLKHYNLTFMQSHVIAFLQSRDGQATQKELELFLKVSHPTVVGLVSRMEQKGYLISWQDEKDKRNKIVRFTPEAEQLSMEMDAQMRRTEAALLYALSAEQIEQLKELLHIIYRNLE